MHRTSHYCELHKCFKKVYKYPTKTYYTCLECEKIRNKINYLRFKDISNNYHVDHALPVFRGGKNDIDNIDFVCKSCNSRKNTKTKEEFLYKIGTKLRTLLNENFMV